MKALEDVDVVTGSRKSGWGPWKKRKDVWGDLLSAYPQLIKANGDFDQTLAETILSTQKLSDEGKQAIQQAIDNAEQVESAYTEMKDYLTGIFGDLGMTITDAFVESFKGTKDAMKDMFDSAGDMLESFVKDFVYSMTLAPVIEKASTEMMEVQKNLGLTDKQKMDSMINIVGNMVDDALKQQDIANELLGYAQNKARDKGIDIFKPETDSYSQSSSKGGFDTMTQDQAGALEGRFTGLYEIGLRMEEILSGISLNNNNIFRQTLSIVDEMKKHTDLLNDIKQIQLDGFFEIEGTAKSLKGMDDKLDEIKKNTKGLISKN